MQPDGLAAVLMDVQMPVMDGLASIRDELALVDPPVISRIGRGAGRTAAGDARRRGQ